MASAYSSLHSRPEGAATGGPGQAGGPGLRLLCGRVRPPLSRSPASPALARKPVGMLVVGDSGFGSHRCPSVLGFSWPRPRPAGVGSQAAGMFWCGRLGLTLAGRGRPGGPGTHDSRSPPAASRSGEVFIAASGRQGWRRQQELWHRPPPQAPQPPPTPSLPLPSRSLAGQQRGSGLRRQQAPSHCFPGPWGGPGASLCLAGASASAGLARTPSVSSAPRGHPAGTRCPGLLLSRWRCLLLWKGSLPGVASSLPRLPGPRGVSQKPASRLPLAGTCQAHRHLARADWEEVPPKACYLPGVPLGREGRVPARGPQGCAQRVASAPPSATPREGLGGRDSVTRLRPPAVGGGIWKGE